MPSSSCETLGVEPGCVLTDRLERERDEAQEDARAARRERDEAIRTREEQDTEAQHRATQYCREKREAERERDEALAEVAKLKTLLTEIANEPDQCVLCGADTRQQKDCRSCSNTHHGSRQCFRRGEHHPECGLKPYETIRRKDGA